MLANIFQLSAGLLLGISSFLTKQSFQMPVLGQKMPGSLNRHKQKWLIRIGLILLIVGYALPILEIDFVIREDYYLRVFSSVLFVIILVSVSYLVSSLLAKRAYKKEPPLGEAGDGAEPGMIAFDMIENDDK